MGSRESAVRRTDALRLKGSGFRVQGKDGLRMIGRFGAFFCFWDVAGGEAGQSGSSALDQLLNSCHGQE